MNIHLAVVSLVAEDVRTAATFYRDVIGLTILPHHAGDRPHFVLDGCILTIVCGSPALLPASSRFPVVAFSIPDLDAAIENLCLNHVDLPWGVESNVASRWVIFRDPAGNLVEFVEYKQGGGRPLP